MAGLSFSLSQRLGVPSFHGVPAAALRPIFAGQTSIQHLFASSGPAHIARLVIAVVVDAIQSQFGSRTASDVGKEGAEIIAPSFAHLNSSRTVIPVLAVLRIVATLFNRAPQDALCAATHAVRPLLRLASAGRRLSNSQITNKDFSLFSTATATAQIPQSAISARSLGEDGPETYDGSWINRTEQSGNFIRRHSNTNHANGRNSNGRLD